LCADAKNADEETRLRQSHSDDRRRITLELTARGDTLLRSAHASTQAALAQRLSALGEDDRATVVNAMQILQPLFARGKSAACKNKPAN
jgi:DNA-binding MarR family transcriptional regulator